MPPGIPFIIGNEAAERFSYYGMRAILTIFIAKYLWLIGDEPAEQMSEAKASATFHFFAVATYTLPILGALLADVFFGKYHVIIWLSIVYCLGHGALALMGFFGDAQTWLFLGLWLIALGSGGIKPCVSAHVGDQFGRGNQHLLTKVFNWFYWSINLGAFVSSLLTPWLLEWYGPHWAFGVPGVLMAIATLLFWMGRKRFVHVPADANGFLDELRKKSTWIALGKLSIVYCFVAMFWALFDQQGSSWVLQAEKMDREFMGITWLSSQIQALNPILILTFIPLFTYVLYPKLNQLFTLTPLRKVAIGLFLMVASFAVVSIAQEKIDNGEVPNISWQLAGYVLMTASEVMVSIVCLEFSYTQAPRKIKSLVMSLFLLAVAAGNLVAGVVNSNIQQDSGIAGETAVELAGYDRKMGTLDDIRQVDGELSEFASREALDSALTRLRPALESAGFKPLLREDAERLLAAEPDAYGNPLIYEVIDSTRLRLTSLGPDGERDTPWDEILSVKLAPMKDLIEVEDANGDERLTWLERRKLELGVIDEDEAAEPGLEVSYRIGAESSLRGADYFWFFTKLMLVSAIVFLPVMHFYKQRDFLHEDEGVAG